MEAVPGQERTRLFIVLSGLTTAATLTLLACRARLLVPWWVLFAFGVPWVAFSIYLRAHRDGLGSEGKWVDWWSIPHVIGGVLLGNFELGFVWIVAIVVWWECIEVVSRVFEHVTNRVTDVVIALVGWSLAQALLNDAFRLF